jgi:6-pyruvoyltetrahydropterin/6-carboxytetrahydropterin synthase
VLRVFAHKNINVDVSQFAGLIPTTENIALVIASLLAEHWATYFGHTNSRLHRVHIQETARNGFEVLLPLSQPVKASIHSEGSLVHA